MRGGGCIETGTVQKRIERYSDAYKKRKLELFGHVIRVDNEDPMRQVALKQGSITDKNVWKRGVGKPKLDWIQEGRKCAWNTFRSEIDQTDRRNPNRRKSGAKFCQNVKIMERALGKKF